MDSIDKLDIELYEDEIEFYINDFCEKNNIENLRIESQNTFNACLSYIHNKCIRDNIYLKFNPNINNKYNIDKVDELLNIYIYICNLYSKEISISGFSKFSGIAKDTIERWGAEPSCEGFVIWKKLIEENEQSNSDLLATQRNPTGILARLNHCHDWNMPGVKKEISKKEKLTLQDTLKDFEQFKIEQNCQTIDDN